MKNSVNGKTKENLWKTVDVRLVTSSKDYQKVLYKPSFVSEKIFNKNLVVHKVKEMMTLNKPTYVSIFILDLRKTLTSVNPYDNIKKKYDYKAKLLYTDTDSLT